MELQQEQEQQPPKRLTAEERRQRILASSASRLNRLSASLSISREDTPERDTQEEPSSSALRAAEEAKLEAMARDLNQKLTENENASGSEASSLASSSSHLLNQEGFVTPKPVEPEGAAPISPKPHHPDPPVMHLPRRTSADEDLLGPRVTLEPKNDPAQAAETLDPLPHFLCFLALALASLFYLLKLFRDMPPQEFLHLPEFQEGDNDEKSRSGAITSVQGTELLGPMLFGVPVNFPYMPLMGLFIGAEMFLLALLNRNLLVFPRLQSGSPLANIASWGMFLFQRRQVWRQIVNDFCVYFFFLCIGLIMVA